jgi:hypothetical protein
VERGRTTGELELDIGNLTIHQVDHVSVSLKRAVTLVAASHQPDLATPIVIRSVSVGSDSWNDGEFQDTRLDRQIEAMRWQI